MIRVDHAGEYGAVRIYQGQIAVLGSRNGRSAIAGEVRDMAAQEKHHLETFDSLIRSEHARPTALQPLWSTSGYALGVATALLGEKAAMACTAAVEEVIDSHYAEQIGKLGEHSGLGKTIEAFREDEIAHRDRALAHGASEAPAYRVLSAVIRAGCRIAIALAKRI